jgi:hypothetical protein
LTGSQSNVGSDINSISYMRTPDGYRHTDNQLLATATGNGDRTKCIDRNGPDFRPYSVNQSGPSLERFVVPETEDHQTGDAQNFFTVYKDTSGWIHTYFSTDSENASIYYNKYNSSTASWYYAKSKNVLTYGSGTGTGSTAVSDVIVESSAVFHNTHDGLDYSQVMYLTNQTGSWQGFCWGVLAVAFSNNGVNWTGPYNVNNPSSASCSSGGVMLEDCGVLWNGSNLLILAVEGCIADQLVNGFFNSGTTMTYAYLASASDPCTAPLASSTAVNSNGIWSPTVSGYDSSNVLWNCSFCYSPGYQYVYMTRGYAYPSDYPDDLYSGGVIHGDIPCGIGDCSGEVCCAHGLPTFPNRAQVYYMDINYDPTKLIDGSTSWNLLYDLGYEQGYRSCR